MGRKSSHMGVTGKLWLGSVSVALRWELVPYLYQLQNARQAIYYIMPSSSPPVYSSSSQSGLCISI